MIVVKSKQNFKIPFVGLKIGVHSFEFDIDNTFFDSIEYSIIHKGNVKVELQLEKKETMLIGNYSIKGLVETNCNRCNDPFEVDIEGEYRLIYKFGKEPTNDETLIIIYPEEFEIDVKENILELITVSLPIRAVHDEGDCNEEVLSILDEYILISNDEVAEATEVESKDDQNDEENSNTDPRWSALKKLKDKK